MKPKIKRIHNENNDFQRMEVLKRNREKRNRYGEFFVEGVKPINYALENNWNIKSFAYSGDRPLSNWAKGILNSSKADVHFELPSGLMDKLSDKDEEIPELIAVVTMPEDDIDRIRVKEDMLLVIFDRPSSHGNLGTLIRSCEAFGVDGVIVTGHSVDIYDPRTIRASMGTIFAVPTLRLQSHRELVPWFDKIRERHKDFKIVGTSSGAEDPIMKADLSRPMAIVIGNETHGMSYNYKQLCDLLVKIPMYGEITSFNVACAASIILYEADRQRNYT